MMANHEFDPDYFDTFILGGVSDFVRLQTDFGWKREEIKDDKYGEGGKYSIENDIALEIYAESKTIHLSTPDLSVTSAVTVFNITEEGVTFQRKQTENQAELAIFIGKTGKVAILQEENDNLKTASVPAKPMPKNFPPAKAEVANPPSKTNQSSLDYELESDTI